MSTSSHNNNQSVPTGAIPVYMGIQGSPLIATCGASPLASATALVVSVAVAGKRTYVTGLQLDTVSGHSQVTILDGTTPIFTITTGATNQITAQTITFQTPLMTSVNSALSIQSSTAGTSVLWNIQGYVV